MDIILLKSIIVGISLIAIVILTAKMKLVAFVALFLVSLFLAVTVLPVKTIVNTIQASLIIL